MHFSFSLLVFESLKFDSAEVARLGNMVWYSTGLTNLVAVFSVWASLLRSFVRPCNIMAYISRAKEHINLNKFLNKVLADYKITIQDITYKV